MLRLTAADKVMGNRTGEMRRVAQRVMHCPCGQGKVVARGLCGTCYTLKRQDKAYFDGHREVVLARDGYRCSIPGCTTVRRGKRSVAVHHREPGNSDPARMLTLCLACHARVTRVLWREQHPGRHEQRALDFAVRMPAATAAHLFEDAG